MGSKELRVAAMELNRLGVTCGQCKAEIVYDATAPHGPTGLMCPNCDVPMREVVELVRSYREFFRAADFLKDKVTINLLVKLDA